jgi:uncharacterized membrane protein
MKMNKSRLIWGIICLVLAGLLAVLNATLPPENMMFMIGDRNLPIVPAIVLAIVGVFLLATAGGGEQVVAEEAPPEMVRDEAKAALNKRLETIGWGLFLIMLGGFSFIPHEQIPKGYWSIGVGLIMLGLNLARYLNKIRMSGFTTFLGILSLVSGVAQLFFTSYSLDTALFLIILGAYFLLKPWFDRRQLFGKAEEARTE